jgi:hypothetical protein
MKVFFEYSALAAVVVFFTASATAFAANEFGADKAVAEAVDRLFSTAKSIKGLPALTDSKGCLWAVNEEKGSAKLIAILDQKGKQYCRQAR